MQFPPDRAGTFARERQEELANLSDAECKGLVDIEGREVLHYTTKTDPDPTRGGLWSGATSDVYFDPQSMRVLVWNQSAFASYFAPSVSDETSTEAFEYDPTIVLLPPA